MSSEIAAPMTMVRQHPLHLYLADEPELVQHKTLA